MVVPDPVVAVHLSQIIEHNLFILEIDGMYAI